MSSKEDLLSAQHKGLYGGDSFSDYILASSSSSSSSDEHSYLRKSEKAERGQFVQRNNNSSSGEEDFNFESGLALPTGIDIDDELDQQVANDTIERERALERANALSKKYESLDYDEIQNELQQRKVRASTSKSYEWKGFLAWIVTFLIGFFTAIVAYGIDRGVDYFSNLRFDSVKAEICDDCFWSPLGINVAIGLCLVLVSGLLVAFLEPSAAGSGLPEIKCYLNGVKIPKVVRIKTLFVKALGVIFATGGGLAVNKEGPMIHSGAIVAAGVSQGKTSSFNLDSGALVEFRNDTAKRDFVAGGAAAGIATAFGAPIGGVLFAIEEGASFWDQALTWRTLFCSMTATFTLNFFLSGTSGTCGKDSCWGYMSQPGLINFGSFQDQHDHGYNADQLPFFILVGIGGGLLGALFNAINTQVMIFRMRYVKKSIWRGLFELIVYAIITNVITFCLTAFFHNCSEISFPSIDIPPPDYTYLKSNSIYCKATNDTMPTSITHTTVNDMAVLVFETQENAIRALFHVQGANYFSNEVLAVFFVVYFILVCITIGVAAPTGLFVPLILVGATYGRLIGQLLAEWLPSWDINPGTFALVGSAAVLGGIVRMTISLTVILMEATNDVTYGLPIMVTLMCAKWVGDFFIHGLYDVHIELKRIPMLEWSPPIYMRKFHAANVMNEPAVSFHQVEQVGVIYQTLKSTTHNGFPLIDANGKFIGLILRSQLITLMRLKAFRPNQELASGYYSFATIEDFLDDYPRYPGLEVLSLDDTDKQMYIDLTPYMNPVPFTVQPHTPLVRVFRLVRTMGLRHLPVVNLANEPVGIITRKNLCHLHEHWDALNWLSSNEDGPDASASVSRADNNGGVTTQTFAAIGRGFQKMFQSSPKIFSQTTRSVGSMGQRPSRGNTFGDIDGGDEYTPINSNIQGINS